MEFEGQQQQQQEFQIHVVLFPFPALGHMRPALLLAARLVETGIAVVFVTLEGRLSRVYEALDGFEMRADGNSLKVAALCGKEGLRGYEAWNKTGHDHPDSFPVMVAQCVDAEAEFDEMFGRMKRTSSPGSRWCIVSDNMLGWTQDVANRHGVSRYLFYPSPACLLAGVFYVNSLRAQARLPLTVSTSEAKTFVEIPGLPPIETRDMHSLLLDDAPFQLYEFYVNNSRRVHEAAGVLINTFEALEKTALSALRDNRALNPNLVRILPVGPLLPSRQLVSGEEQCMLWLSKQPRRSVVYISLGSIVRLGLEQIEEIAFGLEASQERFLWILRSPDSSEKREILPQGFRGDLGLVVRDEWVPQPAILGHEAIALFVTHCGWNSTLESMCMGIPMLTLPSFADQVLNSKLVVEELGVGWRLSRTSGDPLSRHKVQACIKQAMKEPREKIEALKDVARKVGRDECEVSLKALMASLL